MDERIQSGIYTVEHEWPETKHPLALAKIQRAQRDYYAALDESFKRDLKIAYGFTGELDQLGDNILFLVTDVGDDGDYDKIHTKFDRAADILDGYTVTKTPKKD